MQPVVPLSLASIHSFAKGIPAVKAAGLSQKFLLEQLPIRHAIAAQDLLESTGMDLPGSDRLLLRYKALIDSYQKHHSDVGSSASQDEVGLSEAFAKVAGANLEGLEQDVSYLETQLRGGVNTAAVQSLMQNTHTHLIATRLLVGQHNNLVRQAQQPSERAPSVVANLTVPEIVDLCQHTAEDCRAFCVEKYGEAPEVRVCGPARPPQGSTRSLVVEAHAHYILMELLKNAMRAELELWGQDVADAPPITVVVSSKDNELGIRVSDAGGGIPAHRRPFVWNWFYSTAPQSEPTYTYSKNFGAPFTGYGMGLAMARTFARVAGGSMSIRVLPGHGTDAYVWMNRLGTHEIDT